MKRKLISILIGNLFVAVPFVYGAEGLQVSGSVSLGLRHVNDKATDSSKLQEYRDLDSNALTAADVNLQSENQHFNGFVENIGHDDYFARLRGGQYGAYKYELYGNGLRHNFGSGVGARTPYSGVGGATLTATFPATNTATWNTFDNSYKRQDIGGMFEWQANSPWYFRTDANQVKREGIKVISGAQGTSPGNGFVELPVPVDFKATNIAVEGGYATKERIYSLNFMHSKFSNDNQLIRFSNGFFGNGLDSAVREPDNEFWKLSGNGIFRQLPMHSTLATRVSYSKLSNDVGILGGILNTGGAISPTNPSTSTFDGKIVNTTASASLTSNPLNRLDTRLYWNWTRKDNKSTEITFATAAVAGLACSGFNCTPELFNYRKNNLGVEAGYRVTRENKLLFGYDYYDTKRERFDSKNTRDNKYFVEWKNSTFDIATGRLKYQYLQRRSSNDGFDPVNPIDQFVRRFDIADVNQHQVKLVLDVAPPVQFLDIGLEAIYKSNDYKNTILGRTSDRRQEYFASISYGDPKALRVMVFGDFEWAEYDSFHRVGTGNPDPATAPTVTTYNWSSNVRDKSWQVGIGADWVAMERLTVKSSLSHLQTNGYADFNRQAVGPVVPINNYDNTRRTAFNLKGIYRVDKAWSMTAGYAWEKYRFDDIGYQGFRYVVPPIGTQASYLTGMSAFQNYNANIVYLVATYKFQ
jgi:Protein of unknown function (DUF3374).